MSATFQQTLVQIFIILILKSVHCWNPQCNPCQCSELESGTKISDCTSSVTGQLSKIPQLHVETEAVFLKGQSLNTIPEEAFFKGVKNNLLAIDLKKCQVRNIHVNAFKNLESLTGLELSFNELTQLEENTFAFNTKLKKLFIRYNNINAFPEKLFHNLQNLVYLDLSNNKLQFIHPNQFQNNININILSLQSNYLTKFDEKIISNLKELGDIYLDNNPWNCDCKTKDLAKYFKDHNIVTVDDDDNYPVCSKPKQWKNKIWEDLIPEECSIPPKPIGNVTEGKSFEVTCVLDAISNPVEWFLNGQPLDTNNNLYATNSLFNGKNFINTLTINKVTSNDAGVYKCWTNDDEGGQSDETTLYVEKGTKPNFPNPQDEQKLVRENAENYKLKCDVTGYPLPEIQWFINNHLLILPLVGCPVTFDTVTNELVFETFEDYCSGSYTCRATNIKGTVEKTYNIETVKQKPKIDSQDKINATEDGSVNLNCIVAASEGLDVKWTRNGIPLTNKKFNIIKQEINSTHYNFMLSIKDISLNDNGNYKCVANGDESSPYLINVNSPVEIDHGDENEDELSLEPGDEKDVKCRIKGVKNAVITWEYPDCNKNTKIKGSTLELKDVKCSGRYKCIVKTPNRTYKKEFNLSVKKPTISIIQNDDTIYEHNVVTLQCLIENSVKSEPFWTYNGLKIGYIHNMKINKTQIDKNKYYYNLIISDISLQNSGTYKCNLKGQHVSKTVNVRQYNSIKFLNVPKKITYVTKGTKNYELKCKTSGTDFDITWKYNTFNCQYEQYIEDHNNIKNAVLVLKDISDSCTGDYTCEATNKLENEKYNFKLNVVDLERPKIDKLPNEVSKKAVENEDVVLKCLIRSGDDVKPKWLVNGKENHNHEIITEYISPTSYYFNLVLKRVKAEDGGNYKCVVGDFEDSTLLEFVPKVKPNIEYISNIPPIEVGMKNIRIVSKVNGIPVPNGIWHIPTGCKHNITTEKTGNSQWVYLTLQEVSKECTGQYTFTTSNSRGEQNLSFNVDVISIEDPADVEIKTGNRDDTPIEGENVVLKCLVKSKIHKPQWLRNGNIITNNLKYQIQKEIYNQTSYWYNLQVSKLSQQDKGSYKCRINNLDSEINLNIKPKTKPVIESIPTIPPIENGSKNVRIATKVSGTPIPNATWTLPSGCEHDVTRETKDGSEWVYLTLKEVTKNCAGQYTFAATNSKGEEKSTVDVEVTSVDKPPTVEVKTDRKDDTPIEDENIVLKCLVQSKIHKPQWIRNGHVIKNDLKYRIQQEINNQTSYWYNLYVYKLSQQDKGSYKCRINNLDSNINLNIKPKTKPVIESLPTIPPIEAGMKNVRIATKISGTPIPNTTWDLPSGCEHDITRETKDGSQWVYLTLQEVTKDCAGQFTFKATNSKGEEKSTVDVEVNSLDKPPYVEIKTDNDDTPIEDGNVTLKCLVQSRIHKPQWLRYGQVLTNNMKYQIQKVSNNQTSYWYNLFVLNLSQNDKGSYKCQINNMNSEVTLNVKRDIRTIPIEAGMQFTMGSSVKGSHPLVNPTWNVPYGCSHKITRRKINGELLVYVTVVRATEECSGIYTLTGTNPKDKSEFELKVFTKDDLPKVEIKTDNNDNIPIEDENVILKCFVPNTNHKPQWIRNYVVITNDLKHQIQKEIYNETSYWYNLLVYKLSHQDEGSYNCRINDLDSEITLKIKPKTKPVIESVPIIPPIEVGMKNVQIASQVSGTPVPNTTWNVPSGCKHDITRETKDGSQWVYLTLKEVTKDCSGQYTFSTTNSKGEKTSTVDVKVISVDKPPNVETKTDRNDSTPIEDENVILKCLVQSKIHKPQWIRNGHVITNDLKYQIQKENYNQTSYWYNLHVSKLSQQDKGSYKCRINNLDSDISLNIKPKTKPVIESVPTIPPIENGSKNVRIATKVSGTPVPNATWNVPSGCKHDITRETKDGSEWVYLTLQEVTKDCAGQFTFAATNSKGKEISTFDVDVISDDKPPSVEMKSDNNDDTPIEGENITLKCLVQSKIHKPQWLRNGQIITDNNKHKIEVIKVNLTSYWYNLQILKLSQQDKGSYKCRVNNQESVISITDIRQSTRPKIEYISNPVTVEEGKKDFTLSCKVSGIPKPKVTWKVNNKSVSKIISNHLDCKYIFSSEVDNFTEWAYLTIRNVVPSCSAHYTCDALNIKGEEQNKIHLNVISKNPPQIESPNKTYEGEKVTLKCLIKGNLDSKPVWLHNNEPIQNKHKTVIIPIDQTSYYYILEIKEVSFKENGQYKCKINDMETAFPLNILPSSKPELIPEDFSNDIDINEGTKEKTLPCRARGTPLPKITWYYEGIPLYKDTKCQRQEKVGENQINLILQNIEGSCAGRYKCVTENIKGKTEKEVNVAVKSGEPSIVQPKSDSQILVAGEKFNLVCLVPNRFKYSAKWYKDNVLLNFKPNDRYSYKIDTINETAYWHNLEISNLTASDEASNYKCVVNNKIGSFDIPKIQQPVKPKIEYVPAKYLIVQEGTNEFKLACKASGLPKPTVTWKFEPIFPNNNCIQEINKDSEMTYIVIKKVTGNCLGKYICVTNNSVGYEQQEINLSINPIKPTLQLMVKPNSPDGVIRQNNDVTLQCLINGNSRVNWYYNRNLVKPGTKYVLSQQQVSPIISWYILTIKNVQPNEKGTYTCKSNDVQQSYNLELATETPPSVDYLGSLNQIADENSDLVLQCKVSNSDEANVDWTFNDEPLENSGCNSGSAITIEYDEEDLYVNLTIYNIDDSCSGQFKCEVEGLNHNRVIDVTVLESTQPEIVVENNEIKEGEKVVFKCLITSATSSPKWLHENKEIPSHYDHIISKVIVNETTFWYNLELTNTSLEQEGEYKCISGNSETSENLYIKPAFKPILQVSNSEIIVTEGDELSLFCKSNAWPPASITFGPRIPSTSCQMQHSFDTDFYTIVTPKVQSSCAGQYICTATNSKGQDKKYVDLIVLPPQKPKITMKSTSPDGVIREGDNVILHCSVTRKNDADWTYSKSQNIRSTTYEVDHFNKIKQLTITGIRLEQSGIYTCGTSQYNIDVTSVEVPNIEDTPDSVLTVSGIKSPNIYCKVSGIPKPNINWYLNDKPLPNKACEYEIHSVNQWYNLTINNPIPSCIGIYKCVADNIKGKTEKEILVLSVQPQNPETKIVTTNNNSIVIENEKVTLTCLVTGDITLPVQWLHKGKPIQFNKIIKEFREPNNEVSFWYNLQIEKASHNLSGNYQCKTPFSQSDISLNIRTPSKPTLSILAPPKIFIPEGQEKVITCTTNGIPIPSVTWQRNNKSLDCSNECQLKKKEITNNNNRELHLTVNGSKDCSGKYTCSSENVNGNTEKSVDVVVIPTGQPKINIREPVYPKENSDVTISCEVLSVDIPSISWKKKDENINKNSSKYTFNTVPIGNNLIISNFTIRNFQKSDLSDYTCEAKLQSIHRFKTISLKQKTKSKPYFEKLPNLLNNVIVNNHDLVLINKVKSYPPPNLDWKLHNDSKNSRYKTDIEYINNDSYWFNVTITNFNKEEDSGLYTFTVNNGIGSAQKKVSITISEDSIFFQIGQDTYHDTPPPK